MARKKHPKRSRTIKAHVTEEEYARLNADATRFHFTMSDYVRRVMTEFKIPQGVVNAEAVLTLVRTNSDLARLGNLFKMALNDDSYLDSTQTGHSLQKLLREIEETQLCIRELMKSFPRS